MGETILSMEHISKQFGIVRALDDVSLELHSGEVLALMGENGAGKSTLMNILSGSLMADQGDILIGGEKKQISDPITANRNGICKIHQELQIVNEMSVAENIFLGRWPAKFGRVDYHRLEEDARIYLDMLEIKVDPKTKMKDLRIGEQQLVEIAKALSLNLKVIIMDEPTSSISEKEAEKLFTIIRRLRADGNAIIYISHRMEEIFKIADRIMVMRDGRHIDTVAADQVNTNQLIKMMVGRNVDEQYPKEPTTKGEVVLAVNHLSYHPPKESFKRSLQDISLQVRKGEVLGIAGLAGAGRSELFECIAGMHDRYVSGEIQLEGQTKRFKNPSAAIAAGISFATEDRKKSGLVLQRSIGENMSLPLLKQLSTALFMKQGQEKKLWQEQMDGLRIKAPSAQTAAGSLSGGNQQKVVLGRWLLTEPKVLLLDEPTRGIDVGAKAEIYQLINRLAMAGMAIIVISSELPEVIGISDRILTLCEGRLTGEFTQDEATQENLLVAATTYEEGGRKE